MFGWVDDCLHSVERKEGRTGRPISGFVTHVIPLFSSLHSHHQEVV